MRQLCLAFLLMTPFTLGCHDPTFPICGHPICHVVSVDGYQLNVQSTVLGKTLEPAKPYKIKGVGWSPASVGSPPHGGDLPARIQEMLDWYEVDIPLMKKMGVNTVKTYHDPGLTPEGLAILDAFYRNGIRVIMTVDNAVADADHVEAVVNYYKNHPAILMWLIGNEWNYNGYYGVHPDPEDAKAATEALALAIQSYDDSHPVATSIGYTDMVEITDIVTACPSVDVWGVNIYIGASFNGFLEAWKFEGITKPVFMSEMGADAYHTEIIDGVPSPGQENQKEQADYNEQLWWEMYANFSADDPAKVLLGGTYFEWNDEWWKAIDDLDGTPAASDEHDTGGSWRAFPDHFGNEEWFGLVDIYRHPRRVFYVLKNRFRFRTLYESVLLEVEANEGESWSGEWDRFYKGGARFYSIKNWENFKSGRGMNAVVLDRKFAYVETLERFDTYEPWEADLLEEFLEGLDDGKLVMMATCDEASRYLDEEAREAIEFYLGSELIDQLGFRGSWAIISVKGAPGTALAEGLDNDPWADLAIEADVDLDADEDGIVNAFDHDDDDDGLSDIAELIMRSDPLDPDSDDDGILDGDE